MKLNRPVQVDQRHLQIPQPAQDKTQAIVSFGVTGIDQNCLIQSFPGAGSVFFGQEFEPSFIMLFCLGVWRRSGRGLSRAALGGCLLL